MDADTLRDLYEAQRLTTRQVAERAGVSHMTVKRWLRKHGIAARHAGRGLANRGLPQPTADELRRLVHEEHVTYAEVARRYGVTERAVHYWLDSFGIPRATVWMTRRKGVIPPVPSANELRRLYVDEGLSLPAIGARFGVSAEPIRSLIDRYSICTRPKGFSCNPVVCNDGHLVRSSYERLVDDWLSSRGIEHEHEPQLPFDRRLHADFIANGWYIEVWGVAGNEPYNERRAKKVAAYREHGLPLIEISFDAFDGPMKDRWQDLLAHVLTQSR